MEYIIDNSITKEELIEKINELITLTCEIDTRLMGIENNLK